MLSLGYQEIDGEEMAGGAAQDEEMPQRVHVFMLVEEEEHTAYGVEQSTGNQPVQDIHRVGPLANIQERFEGNDYHPPHHQVASRLKVVGLLHLPKAQDNAYRSSRPYHSKQQPSPAAFLPKRNQCKGSIRPCYMKVDGTMVEPTEQPLALGYAGGMIEG